MARPRGQQGSGRHRDPGVSKVVVDTEGGASSLRDLAGVISGVLDPASVELERAANPYRPALPSILLSNVRSLENKMDYLRLDLTTQHKVRDCSAVILTETWLNQKVPD